MKYFILASMLCLVRPAHGETTPYSKPIDFSKWYDSSEFSHVLKNIPVGKYPIIIEAGPVVGDGVVYRVLLKPKPIEDFEYRYMYSAKNSEFSKKRKKFAKLGFTLIYHQKVQLMGGKVHQAVWVKRDL